MSIQCKHLNRLFCALSIGALVAVLGIHPVSAKDTDVYLMSPTVARDDSPNVLIILDNSGSMESNSITSRPPYDPSTNYCNVSGAPAGSICNGTTPYDRIFWTFNALTNPPGSSTSNWFDSTKNKCLDSASALGTSGYYPASPKIARWCSTSTCSSGNRKWLSLNNQTNSTIQYVDCQADNSQTTINPTADGLTTNDGQVPQNSGTSAYVSDGSNQAFSWAGFTTNAAPTLLSANYLAYLKNTTLATTQTRMQIAKDAVKSIIDAYRSVRLGLMVFNANDDQTTGPNGGRLLMKVDTMTDARRTQMKTVVDGICGYKNCATGSSSGSVYTPLSETMWEAYRYFAGLGVDYGDDWPAGTPARDTTAESGSNYISPFKYGCQKGYIIIVTDGDPTHDVDADSKIKGLSGLGSSTCQGILGTSGDATQSCLKDLAGWMYNNDVLGSLAGPQNIVTFTVGFGSGISAGAQQLLTDTAAAGKGVYAAANSNDELTFALQSAVSKALEQNTSFSAPSLSINAFNKLYNRDDVYFALFKPSSTMAWDGNIKRFRLCNTSDVTSYGCTFGAVIDSNNVAAIDNSSSKILSTAKSYWSASADGPEVTKGGAGEQITKDTSPPIPRTVYTYRGTYASASMPATPVAVVATPGNSIYDAAINDPTILGLADTSGSPADTNAADTAAVSTLIKWMRGQDAYDSRLDNGSDTGHTGNTDEARNWNFSDPLHSRPVAFTFGAELDGAGKPDPTKPIIKLFVGTNDGMVRIIDNDTGKEEWAFIPQEMLNQQYALSQDTDGDHIYGMDDSPAFLVTDVNNDGIIDPATDKVYMYIGMRRGGRNIYAFDVTPSATMTAQTDTVTPKLLWVIQGGTGNFTKLGQTWSRPKIARIRAKCTASVCDDGNPLTNDSQSRMVLILGGGYDPNQDNGMPPGPDGMGNAIYIVDPFTGSRIWWASSDTGANLVLPKMKYSIPSEITALDTNGDKSVDRLYVGDMGGQLWRIDLGDQVGASSNDGSSGYVFADVGCDGDTRANDCAATTKQNQRKFFYPPDVAQVKDANFSTTENYDLVVIGSGNREDPLDLLTTNPSPAQEAVHNRLYAFRDYDYKLGAPASTPSALTDNASGGDLYDATANNLGTMTGSTLQTEIDTKVKTSKGWFIDLKEANSVTLTNGLTTTWVGEKVLAKPVIYNGVIFATTFIPANDATALTTCQANEGEGRFYEINYLTGTPAYDLNGDSIPDRFAIAGGGIPSEVIIVIRDGGVTGLVGTSGGAKQVTPGGGQNRYKTFWWDE